VPVLLQAVNNAASVGWKPQILINNGSALTPAQLKLLNKGAGEDVLLTSFFKDPAEEQWKDDPALAEFKKWWAATPNSDKYVEATGLSGWMAGELFAEAFTSAKSADRAALIESVHNLSYAPSDSLIMPDIAIQTEGKSDPYLIEGERIAKFDPKTGTMEPLETIDLNGQK